LRRNALLVLGNRGDPGSARLRALLGRYRASDDEFLAEHAEWALRRLDGRVGGPSTDTSSAGP
jgi:epoxyqueuosine reductase